MIQSRVEQERRNVLMNESKMELITYENGLHWNRTHKKKTRIILPSDVTNPAVLQFPLTNNASTSAAIHNQDKVLSQDAPAKTKTTKLINVLAPAVIDDVTILYQWSVSSLKVYLIRNGKVGPVQIEGEENGSSMPLLMALVNKKKFIFGTQALNWIQTKLDELSSNSSTSNYTWDLGKLFQSKWKLSYLYKTIVFDNDIYKSSLEFLLAIFIHNLKRIVEQKLGNSASATISRSIFTVPLWMGSSQRQRLLDAAEIAGFETVLLMNEITAVTLFHAISKSETIPNSKRKFLVLVENSCHLDVATYEFNKESNEKMKLEMISCSGDLYESEKSRLGVERSLKKEHYLSNIDSSGIRTRWPIVEGSIRTLLYSLVREALSDFIKLGEDNLEVIVSCQNKGWKSYLSAAVTEVYNGTPPPVVSFNFTDSFQIQVELLPESLVELSPYSFFRKDAEMGGFKDALFVKCNKLPKEGQVLVVHEKIHCPETSTQVLLFQKNILGEEMLVGRLVINKCLYYMYQEIETRFDVNENGIYKFNGVFGSSYNAARELEMTAVPKTHVIWKGVNLMAWEVESYKKLLVLLTNSYQKVEDKMFKTRQDILDLCNSLKLAIVDQNCRKMSSYRKQQILKRVEDGLLLQNISTSAELAEKSLDLMLATLKLDCEQL
ncbi:unnamed protein product [Orchesella dallaii]|uniref:Uncharacterized protein n=1 Tax=Orchesella dallaii TaxID=48710 RepID=A0ABP1RSX1_9HEXA